MSDELREQIAAALDANLPRMAFVKYGREYTDDPAWSIEAYYLRVADALIAAVPALSAGPGLREAVDRMRRAYERGATRDDLVMLVDAALAAAPVPEPRDEGASGWTCDWVPDDLNPGPECPYCAGQMCARIDNLNCQHNRQERHGYPLAAAPVPSWREASRKLHASGDDEPYATDTAPLDVERLAEALKVCDTRRTVEWNAPRVAAEYARLAEQGEQG